VKQVRHILVLIIRSTSDP